MVICFVRNVKRSTINFSLNTFTIHKALLLKNYKLKLVCTIIPVIKATQWFLIVSLLANATD